MDLIKHFYKKGYEPLDNYPYNWARKYLKELQEVFKDEKIGIRILIMPFCNEVNKYVIIANNEYIVDKFIRFNALYELRDDEVVLEALTELEMDCELKKKDNVCA